MFLLIRTESLLLHVKSMVTNSVDEIKMVLLPSGLYSRIRTDCDLNVALRGRPLVNLFALADELITMEYMAFCLSALLTLIWKGMTTLVSSI